MPVFDYRCDKCGSEQEELVCMYSDKAEPVIYCRECGCIMCRVISKGVGIRFKGSGFYVNDYGSDKK